MPPEELFRTNLALIDEVIARVCRRSRLYGADAEDFASSVKLALIEDDYAILGKYEGRSTLSAFLTVAVQRMLIDQRMQTLGRFQPSNEARRHGEAGLLIETLLRRDRRSPDEALPIVRAVDPEMTREKLQEIAARLPERTTRPRAVELPDDVEIPAAETAEDRAIAHDLRRLSDRMSGVVREVFNGFSSEERMLIRCRFGSSMSIADISRMMRMPQRPLYRRLESLLARLRAAFARAGIDSSAVSDLIGSATAEMNFGIADRKTDGAQQSNMTIVGELP
jgi:RNA polymerase sigma factor for flagellar operon FliA